jgi:VIT1/CCC1 family predicted Fe2+/Mn2+ transporter
VTGQPAPAPARPGSERLLDPISRISEILFGLIMVLTFTGAISAATAEREEIRTLLIGAIGCNIAWGLVDAVMYLMSSLTERGRGLITIRSVQTAGNPEEAYRVITDAVPPVLASIWSTEDIERVRQGLLGLRDLPPQPLLSRDDWLGALGIFLLVFLSTFPVVIPFLVFSDAHVALRVSNLVAIVMMFLCGYKIGRLGGYHPWLTGATMAVLGMFLAAIAIALEA